LTLPSSQSLFDKFSRAKRLQRIARAKGNAQVQNNLQRTKNWIAPIKLWDASFINPIANFTNWDGSFTNHLAKTKNRGARIMFWDARFTNHVARTTNWTARIIFWEAYFINALALNKNTSGSSKVYLQRLGKQSFSIEKLHGLLEFYGGQAK
jgi:hypothetical protein